MRRSDTLAARNMYNVVRLREAAGPARGRIFSAPVMTFISLHLISVAACPGCLSPVKDVNVVVVVLMQNL